MFLHSLAHARGPSIALISTMAAAHLTVTTAIAEKRDAKPGPPPPRQTIKLPVIGNTIELDRSLSREVSDTFVFDHKGQDQAIPDQIGDTVVTAEPAFIDDQTTSIKTHTPMGETKNTVTSHQAEGNDQSLDKPVNHTPVLLNSATPGNTVWQQIIKSDRLPLTDNERVKFYVEQYQRESLWISKILHRGIPFLAHMVATLDQRFLPVELALLPAIESGYQPTAKSGGNAKGLWQIVPITAKEIGLAENAWFDGRGDVLASTTAAIDYLSYLNAEFDGDWELTLAAYNAGPGRIRAAIRENEKNGLPTDYWSLNLPLETINYVPKVIAMISLINMPDHGGLNLPDIAMEPAFESIDVGFRVSLERVAEIADIDLDLLRSLNAGLIHGVTAPQGPHYLLIPTGSGEQFQQAFSSIDRNTAISKPDTHNVASGDTISSIALKKTPAQIRGPICRDDR